MKSVYNHLMAGFFALVLYSACTPPIEPRSPEHIRQATNAIDDQRLTNASQYPDDWTNYGLNTFEDRFSPLDEINTETVKDLSLAWSLPLGTKRGIEATPIVVEGIMYLSGPWSKVYAIDALTGTLIWTFDPQVPKHYGEKACCDVVNRGVAMYKGQVFVGTLDGRLIAIDAVTGTSNWEKLTVDSTQYYTSTGAPRIVKGKVIIGNGGAEYGVRGYITAYDAMTGAEAWRFYTVPGNPADGFESEAMETAAKTWTGEWWKYGGGGTVWDAMAYDPALNLLYIGTGNGSPWNWHYRSPGGGDNLFLSSILAINPDDGSLQWHYQTTPADAWDFTATQHIMLADITIAGQDRKVLMQAPKNGFFYVLDRATGELISGEAYTYVNWATGIDLTTGRPIENEFARYGSENAMVSPNYDGGHNWQPMAFNKNTGLVYIPTRGTAAVYGHDPNWTFGESSFAHGNGWNLGTGNHPDRPLRLDPNAPDDMPSGKLMAWDPASQKEVWTVKHNTGYNGGVLSTAGNLVFQGTAQGDFVAYDAATGAEKWRTSVGSGVIAAPMTFAIDGQQYITIAVGWGGGTGLKNKFTEQLYPGRIFTYRIGGTAPEVTFDKTAAKTLIDIPFKASEESISHGATLFSGYCAMCHTQPGAGGGIIPDLAYSTPSIHASIQQIVREGLFLPLGMPNFGSRLTESDVNDIQHFILSAAKQRIDNQ